VSLIRHETFPLTVSVDCEQSEPRGLKSDCGENVMGIYFFGNQFTGSMIGIFTACAKIPVEILAIVTGGSPVCTGLLLFPMKLDWNNIQQF
jgi:hypothetical protein